MYTELRIIYFSNTYSLSDQTLEQREFGILSDVVNSGVKRSYQKYVGKARRSIGNKLKDSIRDDMRKANLANNYAHSNKIVNGEVEKNLIRYSKGKNNSRVIDIVDRSGNSLPNGASKSKDLLNGINESSEVRDELSDRMIRKLKNSAEKSDYIVTHPSGSGVEKLSHEIGHIENSKGGIFKGVINRMNDNIIKNRSGYNKYKSDRGIGKSVKEYLKGKVNYIEERNASKNAMKLLKDQGLDNKGLSESKRSLDAALDSYKYGNRVRYKIPLMNKIQIPSRRIKQ